MIQFQEHEKRMRQAARTTLHDAKDAKDSKDSAPDYNVTFAASEEAKAQSKGGAYEGGSSSLSATGAKGLGGAKASSAQYKPAWAMTEQAAGEQDDELRQGEEDELLEFARGLDFDRYIGDVEVQTVMERLRRRIADLEREVAIEDLRNADADTRAALRAKLEQMVSV